MLRYFKLLAVFAADRRGSIGVIFSLALLPTFMMLGSAIDYTGAVRARAALHAAADMAALATAKKYAQEAVRQGLSEADAVARGKGAGEDMFKGNIPANVIAPSINLTVSATAGGVVTATAEYSAKAPIYFARLMGFNNVPIDGRVVATHRMANQNFKNFFLAVDVSNSMGIGATQADMNDLKAKTNCIFGCHIPSDGQTISNAQVARNNGITMRIDVVRQAVLDMIATAEKFDLEDRTRFAILPMYEERILPYPRGTAITGDYGRLKIVANNIDLWDDDGEAMGDTGLINPLTIVKNQLSNYKATDPYAAQNFVFIMTDGLKDVWGKGCYSEHCTDAFDAAWCQQFKNLGATVGVIHTVYIPFTADSYTYLVKPHAAQIEPNLKSCASPGFYFQASEGPEIKAKIAELFDKALQLPPPRLTQ